MGRGGSVVTGESVEEAEVPSLLSGDGGVVSSAEGGSFWKMEPGSIVVESGS